LETFDAHFAVVVVVITNICLVLVIDEC
jgi:hypothetical protein